MSNRVQLTSDYCDFACRYVLPIFQSQFNGALVSPHLYGGCYNLSFNGNILQVTSGGFTYTLKGLLFQGNQHVEVYSRGRNVTPRTAGKEDWLRRFYNSAVECMAAISGYSKSQIADATSGMFNSIIRLA